MSLVYCEQKYICSICQKITKLAVRLPCDCQSVCREHIDQLLKLKDNESKIIVCSICDKTHEILKTLESDQLLNNEIATDLHLSNHDKSKKILLEEILDKVQNQIDDLTLKMNEFSLEQANHFENIRREIDIRRETIIEKAYLIPNEANSLKLIEKIQQQSDQLIKLTEKGEEDFRNKYNSCIVPNLIKFNVETERERMAKVLRDTETISLELEKFKNEYETCLSNMQKKQKIFKLLKLDLESNRFLARLKSLGDVELNTDLKRTFFFLRLSGQSQLIKID
jgi:hypothetical protein